MHRALGNMTLFASEYTVAATTEGGNSNLPAALLEGLCGKPFQCFLLLSITYDPVNANCLIFHEHNG